MENCNHENKIDKNINYKNKTIEYDTFCAKCDEYLGHSKFKVITDTYKKRSKQ